MALASGLPKEGRWLAPFVVTQPALVTGVQDHRREKIAMNPMQKVDILRAACSIAGIDGKQPTESERAVINKLASDSGVGRASLEAMIARGARDPKFHEDQFRILKDDPKESITALLEVAMADGELTDAETNVLRSISQKLSIPTDVFDELISNVTKMLG